MWFGCGHRKALVVGGVFAVALLMAAFWAWRMHSAYATVKVANRISNLKMLYVALWYYADKEGSFPVLYTTNGEGRPMQSWRVLLLPYLDQKPLYSQMILNQPWDNPLNRRLLGLMPESYRSPLETEKHGTTTNYLAVLGPHAPWGSSIESVRRCAARHPAEIMLVEVVGSKTPWMAPRDLTLEDLLDILLPESDNNAGSSRAADIMYLTISGDVRTVERNIDRESLRGLLLGRR